MHINSWLDNKTQSCKYIKILKGLIHVHRIMWTSIIGENYRVFHKGSMKTLSYGNLLYQIEQEGVSLKIRFISHRVLLRAPSQSILSKWKCSVDHTDDRKPPSNHSVSVEVVLIPCNPLSIHYGACLCLFVCILGTNPAVACAFTASSTMWASTNAKCATSCSRTKALSRST